MLVVQKLPPILDLYSGELINYTISARPVLSLANFVELLYLKEFQPIDYFEKEPIDYLEYHSIRRIKTNLKGWPSALHRQQALLTS